MAFQRIALFILPWCAPLQAATIFQSGESAVVSTPVDGMKSDNKGSVIFPQRGAQWTAAPFSISNAETIQAITFEGFFVFSAPPALDQFEIRFYERSGNLPGTVIGDVLGTGAVNRIDTGVIFSDSTNGDSPIFRFELNLDTALSLSAGDYWISITHTSTNPEFAFYWSSSSQERPIAFSDTGPEGPFYGWGGTQVFTLENAPLIPEPSVPLMAAGAGLLLLYRRK